MLRHGSAVGQGAWNLTQLRPTRAAVAERVHRALQPVLALGLVFPDGLQLDRGRLRIRYELALDIQLRAAQHGHRGHLAINAVSVGYIARPKAPTKSGRGYHANYIRPYLLRSLEVVQSFGSNILLA